MGETAHAAGPSKPNCCDLSTDDRAVTLDLERFMAECMSGSALTLTGFTGRVPRCAALSLRMSNANYPDFLTPTYGQGKLASNSGPALKSVLVRR